MYHFVLIFLREIYRALSLSHLFTFEYFIFVSLLKTRPPGPRYVPGRRRQAPGQKSLNRITHLITFLISRSVLESGSRSRWYTE